MNPTASPPERADVEIRPLQPADAEAALACHHAVFATAPPRSLAHWRWRFEHNPSNRNHTLVASHGGTIVGVYGAIPIRVSTSGYRDVASQIVDVGVRPEWLRAGAGQLPGGLFPRLAHAFVDRWIGDGPDQVMFAYGLPVHAWRSASQHLGWQIARDWNLTFRELPPGAPARAAPADLEVEQVPRFEAAVDALFRTVEAEGGLMTVRDQRYLNWRYAEHPDRAYTLFTCRERSSGTLRGAAVYRRGDLVRANTGFLLDWLAPANDRDASVALLAAIERTAQADGTGLLCSVWSAIDPRFLLLQELGYRVRGTPWFLTTMATNRDVLFFREQWRFTLGDSDLL